MSTTKTQNTVVPGEQSLFVELTRDNLGPTSISIAGRSILRGETQHRTVSLGLGLKLGQEGSITGESGRKNYNNCSHSQTQFIGSHSYVSWEKEVKKSGSTVQMKCNGPLIGSRGAAGVGTPSGMPSWPDSTENAVNRCFASMEYGLTTAGFNLPQFLGELRDFSHLHGKVQSGFGRLLQADPNKIGKLRKSLRSSISARRIESFGDLLKGLAQADLFYQFGIKPLVADVKAMARLGRHLSIQRHKLQKAGVVRIRRRVSDSRDGDSTGNITTFHTQRSHYSERRLVCAWSEVEYDHSEMPTPSRTMSFLDVTGFDQPTSVIWELLPWSFAVDYFIGVGDFVSQFERENAFVQVPYKVLRQGYSVKTEQTRTIELSLYSRGSSDYTPNSGVTHSCAVVSKQYTRKKVTKPPGVAFPVVRLPSFRQSMNLAEIFLSRVL